LGIVGGTVLEKTKLADGTDKKSIETPYGRSEVYEGSGFVFIQRHGEGNVPPHRINHKANIWALKKFTDTVVGVGSVGSLKRSLKPPAIVVPEDYIELFPVTFYDDEIKHVTPGFDLTLRKQILDVARWNRIKVAGKGVYVQTRGPRLETKAEVSMLSNFGDVVGMTLASEATLACELGLKYAAVCSVDNLAHGLSKGRLEFMDVVDAAKTNAASVEKLLHGLVGESK